MKIKHLLASPSAKITLGRRAYPAVEQFAQLFAFGSKLSEFICEYCKTFVCSKLTKKVKLLTPSHLLAQFQD